MRHAYISCIYEDEGDIICRSHAFFWSTVLRANKKEFSYFNIYMYEVSYSAINVMKSLFTSKYTTGVVWNVLELNYNSAPESFYFRIQ